MAIIGAFAVPHPPLIIPGVADGRERGIAATVAAYEEVGRRIAELAPDTIVISSPHATLYRDYFHISPGVSAQGNFVQFGAPQAAYRVRYDTKLVATIVAACEEEGIEAGTGYERDARLDHGTMIPVHFIQKHLGGREVPIVRIGLSGFSAEEHYRLGMQVQRAARELGRRVVYVASGDLAHKLLAEGPYGYAKEGPIFDRLVTQAFASGDLLTLLTVDPSLAERAAECGLRSFQMMAGALDGTAIRAELLSYEGPFGVGYGVAAFAPVGEEGVDDTRKLLPRYETWRAADLLRRKESEDPYVRLARASLEAYVRDEICIHLPDGLPRELLETRAGCFVSLKVDGQLRGCIGTIEPTRASLAEEICANARSAGTRDPRFSAVREWELDDLVYDVDVLTPPQPVLSAAELDPVRYGVIVSCADGRRGLLLPDLDGVDSVDKQLRIAAQKGHISLDDDDVRLERFEVVRHL